MSKLTRHLLIAGGLLMMAMGVLVVRSWDTFALMIDNVTAMREGQQWAEKIRYPEDLLTYIEAHPERVSLVAYDVDAPNDGIFFRAGEARPLVSVPHLLVLAEYARRSAAGTLDPDRRVPVDSIAHYALPGMGEQRHVQARSHWTERGLVDADSTVALRHVATALARFNDGAAADWLIDALSREAVEALPQTFGLADSEPPLPGSGLHLSWNHHAATEPVEKRLARYRSGVRREYADTAYRLAQQIRNDAAFRRRERERQRQRGTGLSLHHQRAFAQTTYPRGTAADYADLMRCLVQGKFHSDSVSAILQQYIEQPVARDSLAEAGATIGARAGGVPGVLSFASYVRRTDATPPRVVVLFMDDLPIGLFYHLMQTGLDKGFQLRLLGDDAFFDQVRMRLTGASAEANTMAD